ncbi:MULTISPECIES: hypothetical protein [unclassified Treponema]|uniref:hypothetical protein n=1 Tax=unclassified Treponema TaxID=2638727 RepID=UPI0025F288C8|nr:MULTISPECIES: hypothetical protein [unclassified Treponema]
MNNEKVEVDGIEIDVKKARNILTAILIAEKKNIATKEKGDSEMIKDIKKKIAEEVACL